MSANSQCRENWTSRSVRYGFRSSTKSIQSSTKLSLFVSVWRALSQIGRIRPYFLENENHMGQRYKRMLRYYVSSRLRNYPEDTIFQKNGDPHHYAVAVRQCFDQTLPNHWISRVGPVLRPLRSSDLRPCNCFSWDIWNILCFLSMLQPKKN